MQISLDGTIHFDNFDEMIHTYRIAKNAHSKGTIRDDKGHLFPEVSRWLDATGGPSASLLLVQCTTLFPLAVFRAMAEKFLDDREAEARRHDRPYMDNG